MISSKSKNKIIIAGPCAAESYSQVIGFAKQLKKLKIDGIRASLWKPRTQPGFEGVGKKGIPWLKKVAQTKMKVATEVLLPDHVSQIVSQLNGVSKLSQVILWIGARNQNHFLQKEIALRVLKKASNNTLLMIKNQLWPDERHWLGIVDHILKTGFPKKRVLLCHRGFPPNGSLNPNSLRNIPDFEMAMRIKEKTKLPMLLDPSHIGGSVENVISVIEKSLSFSFDGYLIEAHPQPQKALTDSQQQLDINQLKELLKIIREGD